MTMLALRIPVCEGESHTSFTSRLAHHNCCDSMFEFCNDWDISARRLINGERNTLMRIAHLGGVSVDALWASAIRWTNSGYLHGREIIAKPMLRRSQTMICPACIEDDLKRWNDLGSAAAHGRTTWLLEPIHACPKHNIALVDVTRDQNDENRNKLDVHDFTQRLGDVERNLGAWLDATRPMVPTSLERYVLNRLEGIPPPETPWLNAMKLYSVVTASEVIGAVDLHGPKVDLKRFGKIERRELGAVGFRYLQIGTDGARSLLERLFSEPSLGHGDIGPRSFLGQFYRWLTTNKSAEFDWLRDITREVTLHKMALDPSDTVFGNPIGERHLHSVHSSAKECGIHPKRLRKLLSLSGFLDKSSDGLPNHQVVFQPDARTQEFLLRVRRSMSLAEAGKYLNAPRVQAQLLYEAGLIVPFIRGGQGDGLKDHAFDQNELDTFLGQLSKQAKRRTVSSKNMFGIPAAAKRTRCSTIDIVRMLLDQKLTCVEKKPDVPGFMSILVPLDEVIANLGIEDRPGLSLEQVHKRMGWSCPVATALVKYGYLPSQIITNPINRRRQKVVEEQDLNGFNESYVSLFALAKERDCYYLELKRNLDRLGILPVFDRSQVPASFYLRASLPPP